MKLNQIAQVKETITSTMKTTHQEVETSENKTKESSEEEKEREEKEENQLQRRKCRYEDKGRCRDKEKCKFFHPKGTCKTYSSTG